MNLRLISPAQWQTMPWANGGGITHEILKDSAQPWRYRLSIAEVASAGPFSTFDGIDRQIMMLEGNGFILNFAESQERIVQVHEPFAFAGEASVQCDLVQGAVPGGVRDFNVMTRRSAFNATVQVLELNGQDYHWSLSGGVHALLVLQGSLTLISGSECLALDSLHCIVSEDTVADNAPAFALLQAKALGALCAATRIVLIHFVPVNQSTETAQ